LGFFACGRRRLAVAACGEAAVRLLLAPLPRAAAAAVFLFLRDETGAVEETSCCASGLSRGRTTRGKCAVAVALARC